ncbi:beta-carotene 15,15'-monooxygenase [Chryseobacterium gotjawalense]|uniref:Beta-carotene 15,15'-monooxygenase n=1 Tax=Chryseobacterium gotjawalense TaxID=3042315 RepID=A0ABY8RAA9_9FLAO|nr:beta-carotene 15,15'-monooxygenase [Chryseobacterium sp. wdc7]WHF50885.1 beta-carotene 15,15'-monooxygenase [Chryseobacterium sp. wdc7]
MDTFDEFDQPTGPEKSAGAIISHAFEMYKGVFLYAIAAVLISFAVSLLVQPVSGFNSTDMMEEIKSSGGGFPNLWSIPRFGIYSGLSGLVSLLSTPLYVGLIYITNKYNLQESISFSDLFIGFRQNFLNIILYSLITSILMFISAMMCFLPVFFILPFFLLGYPILLFENASFSQALGKSFSIAKENYGTFLGASFLGLLISVAGIFLCGIGIIFTLLFYLVVMYSAYCAFCGRPRPIAQKLN